MPLRDRSEIFPEQRLGPVSYCIKNVSKFLYHNLIGGACAICVNVFSGSIIITLLRASIIETHAIDPIYTAVVSIRQRRNIAVISQPPSRALCKCAMYNSHIGFLLLEVSFAEVPEVHGAMHRKRAGCTERCMYRTNRARKTESRLAFVFEQASGRKTSYVQLTSTSL